VPIGQIADKSKENTRIHGFSPTQHASNRILDARQVVC
jgi:hypothetical protein